MLCPVVLAVLNSSNRSQELSAQGIPFAGYLDSCRKSDAQRVICGIVQPGEVDPESGILLLKQ